MVTVFAVLIYTYSAWQQERLRLKSAVNARHTALNVECDRLNSSHRRLFNVSKHLQWSVTPRNREVLRLPLRSTCTVVVDFLLLLQTNMRTSSLTAICRRTSTW